MAASHAKKRLYNEDYIKYGFTVLSVAGIERPQCVICYKALSAESMKPSLLKRHLEGCHSELKDKDATFFQRKEAAVKRSRLDATGAFRQQTTAAVEASYAVAYRIAQQKKPHTIAENLILPCVADIVRIMLGEESAKKLLPLSLSNNTMQRRIDEMSQDIKSQVISQIKNSPMGLFAIQVDEYTDVASCAQLMVFTRFVHEGDLKEEFLFCEPLETHTRGIDIFGKIKAFFDREGLEWKNLCGTCTDGAPAMLGRKSGFQAFVREQGADVLSVHCMIHRYALASKALPSSLSVVLAGVVETVNYIKGSALNERLFAELCRDMDSGTDALLYHSEVRWLSRGNVVQRVFSLRQMIQEFLALKKKSKLVAQFEDAAWITRLAYLVDIFSRLNILNMSMQGSERTILDFVDKGKAFLMKLELWHRKVSESKVDMFDTLNNWLRSKEETLDDCIKSAIQEHLMTLHREMSKYLEDVNTADFQIVRNPFPQSADCISDTMNEVQEEFIEMVNDSSAKELFLQVSLPKFWCAMATSYPRVSRMALKILIPFPSTYLCESGFSHLLLLKTKQRNRLVVENDLRCTLSKTVPRIAKLVAQKQAQPSH